MSQELILPMTSDQLHAAIVRPALQVRFRFDDGLVSTLVDAVAGQPGDLPLLQFTLSQLWLRRDETRLTLTWTAYTAIGGVRGAIAKHAESFLAGLDLDERARAELRRVLVRLVEVRERTAHTRRRATRAELESLGSTAIRPVFDRLINEERLLTSGEDGVEVAHEALIREWKTLREWVNGDRELLLWRERFRGLRAEWQRRDRDPGALLPPALLTEAERWLGERPEIGTQPTGSTSATGSLAARRSRAPSRSDASATSASDACGRRLPSGRRRPPRRPGHGWCKRLQAGVHSHALVGELASSTEWLRMPPPENGQFMMGCVLNDKQCTPFEEAPDESTKPPSPHQTVPPLRHHVPRGHGRALSSVRRGGVDDRRLGSLERGASYGRSRRSGDDHPGGLRLLARRERLLRIRPRAPAHRGGVGVRGPRRERGHDLPLGERLFARSGERQGGRRERQVGGDRARRILSPERLRVARHDRQRVGVDLQLVP